MLDSSSCLPSFNSDWEVSDMGDVSSLSQRLETAQSKKLMERNAVVMESGDKQTVTPIPVKEIPGSPAKKSPEKPDPPQTDQMVFIVHVWQIGE